MSITATNERALDAAASRLADLEVYACMSSIVSTLARQYGFHKRDTPASVELDNLAEQAFELAAPVQDFEGAAREAGWTESEAAATMGGYPVMGPNGAIRESWQAACEAEDIEPHDLEVYEHWSVSTWLAEQLAANGEKVDADFAGHAVWARTTTGQAISADAVIRHIVQATGYAMGATVGGEG